MRRGAERLGEGEGVRARARTLLATGILVLASAAALTPRAQEAAQGSAVPSYEPASAERGRALASQCLTCHGPASVPLGSPPVHAPKLIGQRPEFIYRELMAYQRGTRTSAIMGAIVTGLSLQDLRDLGAYLSAGGPVRPPVAAMVDSWAHERVHRECTFCHGESGMGEMWGMTVLTGQYRDYLTAALTAYRNGERRDATMGPIAARLTPKEIDQLAEYFSAQTFLRLTP